MYAYVCTYAYVLVAGKANVTYLLHARFSHASRVCYYHRDMPVCRPHQSIERFRGEIDTIS
jgi:hypothetical protein